MDVPAVNSGELALLLYQGLSQQLPLLPQGQGFILPPELLGGQLLILDCQCIGETLQIIGLETREDCLRIIARDDFLWDNPVPT